MKRARYAIVVAVLSFLSVRAFAADVFTYETDINTPWTRAGSPAASCAAYFGWISESLARKHAQPEWQGVCSALHFFGVEANACKFAGFESFGIPPEHCPPVHAGWPDNPHWHIFKPIVGQPVAVTDKGLGQPKRHCTEGNPCDPATGNKIQIEVDYVGAGAFPLRFVRTYNWLSKGLGANLGPKWRHNYDRRLVVNVDAVGVFRDDGAVVKFQRVGPSWIPDADVTDKLEELGGGGWKLTLSDGDLVETYDAAGKLVTIANRAGLTQTLAYFATGPNAGMLQRVADHFGRTIQFAYTPQNHLLSLTDPDGKVIQYDYDTSAQLKSVAYPTTTGPNPTRTYLYQPPSALTGIQDENGAPFASFTYNSSGLVAETKHAAEAGRVQFSYPSSSATTVTSYVTPTLSAQRTYNFVTILGVKYRTSITGAVCATCGPKTQTFDPSTGFPTSETGWNGNKTCLTYNARGLEEKRVEGLPSGATCPSSGGLPAEAREISTQWHATYRLPTAVAEPKRITTYVYGDSNDSNPGNRGSLLSNTVQATGDANGSQAFSATPVGPERTWSYTYNANGQVLTVDGPRTDVSDVTSYSYYSNTDPEPGKRGNLATITNALGHVSQIAAYDAHGKPLTIVDPNGLTTTLAYDVRQRLTSRTVGSETTSYEYDGVGQMTKVTLPEGSFLAYTYDAAHRLTQIADSLGNRIAYTLDLMGNRTREDVFDPASQLAQTRSRAHSNLNRLVQEIGGTNPATQVTSYGYDNQGNVTSITDPLNRVTVNAYDALNRLKQLTDPANGVTGYGYDSLDQLVSVSDPRSNTTGYTVDGLGNLAQQSSPDTGTSANTQDAAGNLITSTDAKGQSASYSYDALNRVTHIVYNQATGTQLKQVDYVYDQGTNGMGRLTSITETSATAAVLQTTAHGYDQKGRIVSESRAIGGQNYTTAYAYDAAGRMTGMTYPLGRTTSYGFYGLGRVSRIETTGGGETRVVVQDVTYHPSGPAKGFTFGNLQAYARSFDLDGRIASHSLAGPTKQLSFDAASRITQITEPANSANTNTYGYDALDRLTNAVLPASTFAYGYDAVGNRLSKSIGGGTDTYSYPATSNRLASITGASSTRSYPHDANGSITGDGVNTYGYDARGRLVSATSGAGGTSFQVNALGQRVRKTSTLGDTIYHYDAQGRLIAESSATGTPIREYLWLADQPVAVAVHGQAGGGCAANPTVDLSNTFVPYARRERMEVHSGRPGERGWEWGLGTNTRDFDETARADLDWVSGKPYGFVLTYDGAGNARVVVRDGAIELFTLTWTGGLDVGNALRFMVKSPAGIGAGNRVSVLITSIDGQPVADTLATAGDSAFSEVVRVYAGAALQNGYGVEGTVTFTFAGSYPPRGNKLDFTVTAGNVTCQGPVQAGPAALYYVHADHLNTPRAITNDAQQLVWRWENQEPFGKSPPEENPSGLGNFEFSLRFTGQYFDKETGLFYNYFRDYDPQTGRYVQSDPIGLDGGINPYIYAYDDPLRFTDPTGEVGLAGAGYGLVAGGVSGYISSGGKWQGAVIGGLAGAAVGAINPFSSTVAGAAAGGVLASAAGQVGGNFAACRDDIWSIDWDLAIVSGVGAGAGRGFATYLAQPRRSAFTYAVNQRMGPGNPVALQSFQATIRGGSSGMAQLGYKSAFYPAGYPPNQCVPQDPCGYQR